MRAKRPGRTVIGANGNRGETTQGANGIRGETTRYHAFQQTYLVKPPQILQPVALLMFRVEAIPMFLLTVPIQICQVKLVLCFTAWSSITNGECVHNFHK